MAVSQADKDRLEAAIASGASSITIDGHTVHLRSHDEIVKARDWVDRQITAQRPMTHLVTFRRGL